MAQWAAVPYRGAERAKERGYHLVNRMIGALRPQARTERSIFSAHRETIAAVVGRNRQFVDLGAGNCAKGEFWIAALKPRRFIAVDIAAAAIEPALTRLAAAHPEIEFTGVISDFSRTLDLAADLDAGAVTLFYSGFSTGNFAPDEALALLAQVRKLCDH